MFWLMSLGWLADWESRMFGGWLNENKLDIK